jgi:hypothetical protein
MDILNQDYYLIYIHILVVSNTPFLSIKFGDLYVPLTSGTHRRGTIYLKSSVTGSSLIYTTIRVCSYTWNGSLWANPVEILNSTFWTNYTNGTLETSPFSFSVPADSSKLICTISHNHSSQVLHRAMLRDFHDEQRIQFKKDNVLQAGIVEAGAIELEQGEANLPLNGSGILFKNGGTTVCRISEDGFLYRLERNEDDGLWLDNINNLSGGFVFRDRNGFVSQFISSNGTIHLRKRVEAPVERPLESPIKIIGPTYETQNVGQIIHLTWEYAPEAAAAQLVAEASNDGGRIWVSICTSGIPVVQGYFDWTVTELLGSRSNCDQYVYFRVRDYSDNFSDKYTHGIKIRCN